METASNEDALKRARHLLLLKVVSAKGVTFVKAGTGDLAASWKQAFVQHTRGGSGVLAFEDLRKLVRHSLKLSERSCPDDVLKLLFREIDVDGSGSVDFAEFLHYIQQREDKEEKKALTEQVIHSVMRGLNIALRRMRIRCEADVRQLFDGVDLNDDNNVSPHEMRRFLREQVNLSPHEASDTHLRMLFNKLDVDQSGELGQQEFISFITTCAQTHPSAMLPVVVDKKKSLGSSASSPELRPKPSDGAGLPTLPNAMLQVGGLEGGLGHGNEGKHPQERSGSYLNIRGGHHLNRIESQLFKAGVDVRGYLFKKDSHGGHPDQHRSDKSMNYLQRHCS